MPRVQPKATLNWCLQVKPDEPWTGRCVKEKIADDGKRQHSEVETYAALRLAIGTESWQGVPFYLRAGKCLPITYTEVVVRLRRPATLYQDLNLKPNALRLRISPEILFALGMNVFGPDDQKPGQSVEMVAYRQQGADEPSAYERVLGDAMKGDATLFARRDYAERRGASSIRSCRVSSRLTPGFG